MESGLWSPEWARVKEPEEVAKTEWKKEKGGIVSEAVKDSEAGIESVAKGTKKPKSGSKKKLAEKLAEKLGVSEASGEWSDGRGKGKAEASNLQRKGGVVRWESMESDGRRPGRDESSLFVGQEESSTGKVVLWRPEKKVRPMYEESEGMNTIPKKYGKLYWQNVAEGITEPKSVVVGVGRKMVLAERNRPLTHKKLKKVGIRQKHQEHRVMWNRLDRQRRRRSELYSEESPGEAANGVRLGRRLREIERSRNRYEYTRYRIRSMDVSEEYASLKRAKKYVKALTRSARDPEREESGRSGLTKEVKEQKSGQLMETSSPKKIAKRVTGLDKNAKLYEGRRVLGGQEWDDSTRGEHSGESERALYHQAWLEYVLESGKVVEGSDPRWVMEADRVGIEGMHWQSRVDAKNSRQVYMDGAGTNRGVSGDFSNEVNEESTVRFVASIGMRGKSKSVRYGIVRGSHTRRGGGESSVVRRLLGRQNSAKVKKEEEEVR